jgi:hypothetical protein
VGSSAALSPVFTTNWMAFPLVGVPISDTDRSTAPSFASTAAPVSERRLTCCEAPIIFRNAAPVGPPMRISATATRGRGFWSGNRSSDVKRSPSSTSVARSTSGGSSPLRAMVWPGAIWMRDAGCWVLDETGNSMRQSRAAGWVP